MLFKYWFCHLILLTVIGAIEVKLMNNIGNFVQINKYIDKIEYNSNFPCSKNPQQNNLTCKKFVHKTFQFTQISINSSKHRMPQSNTNSIKLQLILFQFVSSINLFIWMSWQHRKMLCKYYAKYFFFLCINHMIYQFHNNSYYMSFHFTHSHVSI